MVNGRITSVNPGGGFGFINFHNPGSVADIRFDSEDLIDAELSRDLVGKEVKFYKSVKPDGRDRATKVTLV